MNVFPIALPPLRDRHEDLPLLVWSFVKEYENSMGKTIHEISGKCMEHLQEYRWPTNIRELRNLVENAMIVTNGKPLDFAPPAPPKVKTDKSLKLEDIERNHIRDVVLEVEAAGN